jgi:hypothetical protein
VTQQDDAEGETDMGLIGECCYDDHRQGPEAYVDGENLASTNLVLWYVPQLVAHVDPANDDYYCWTINGEPDPETYPCIVGPLFVPFTPTFKQLFPVAFYD